MKQAFTRRDFMRQSGLAVAGSALGLSGLVGPIFAGGEPELRVGYLPITDSAPLLIAHALGYFKEEGLRLKKPVRVRNWSTLMESFLSGKFNLTHMLFPMPVWMRFKNRVPVKVLAWNHTNGSAITVRGDSAIRSFADLGGHQIAVPYWYSIHNVILQMGLRTFGLKPVIQRQSVPLAPNEVNLFVLPPSEMPAALAGRKIDGYIVADPINAISEVKTGARIMRFTGDIWKNHPCCVVVMNEGLIARQPVFTQKAMNAIVRAQLWITGNRSEAAHILSRQGGNYLPMDEKILHRAFSGYDFSVYGNTGGTGAIHHPEWQMERIGFQPWPYPSATRLLVGELGRTLVEGDVGFLRTLNPEVAAADLVDDRFVTRAIEAVGGPDKFSYGHLDNPFHREEIISV
ncbi:ABC transporter substrate-binding protein [Desulfoluna sp.]|uniref:ABC transporter substrate-binding protein n=1 Tax=Desulfoluna sp. TaxID=2045199 RepID=UPI002604A912|nr:ABC transporter substrate-binding protein [Desulfoluna sp.]